MSQAFTRPKRGPVAFWDIGWPLQLDQRPFVVFLGRCSMLSAECCPRCYIKKCIHFSSFYIILYDYKQGCPLDFWSFRGISPVYHLYIQIHKKQDSGGQLRRLKRLTCEAPVAGAFVMGHPLDSKGFHEIQWDFWRFISPRMVFIYVYIYSHWPITI